MPPPSPKAALIYPVLSRKAFFFSCGVMHLIITGSALSIPFASLLLNRSPLGAVPLPWVASLETQSSFPICVRAANLLALLSGPLYLALSSFSELEVSDAKAELQKLSASSRVVMVIGVSVLWIFPFLHDPGLKAGLLAPHVLNATAKYRLALAIWANAYALAAGASWIFVAFQFTSLKAPEK